MKMTNAQIVQTLNRLSEMKESNRRLPVRLSYAINKNWAILFPLYEAYDAVRKDIAGGDTTAMLELLNTPNDVTLHTVTLDQVDGADLTINEVEVLQTFMMEE